MSGYRREFGSWRGQLRGRFTAAVIVALACVPVGNAADDSARNMLAALVEGADLLQQEAASLVPETTRVRQEGEQIRASESLLLAQTNALSKEIEQYNADVAEQQRAAGAVQARCPAVSADADLRRVCDAESDELRTRAITLEERLGALEARRSALNERIDQHNAARLQWDQRRRDQEARVGLSETEIRSWVERARVYSATDAFGALARQADNPGACDRGQLSGSGEQQPMTALKRYQRCFKAVRAGS